MSRADADKFFTVQTMTGNEQEHEVHYSDNSVCLLSNLRFYLDIKYFFPTNYSSVCNMFAWLSVAYIVLLQKNVYFRTELYCRQQAIEFYCS